MASIAHFDPEKHLFYSLPGFLAAQFPDPDESIDQWSGLPECDLFCKRIEPGGTLVYVIPIESARLWQRQARKLPRNARVRFVVTLSDFLHVDDTNALLGHLPLEDGFVLDVACLTPEHRQLLRRVSAGHVTHVPPLSLAALEGPVN